MTIRTLLPKRDRLSILRAAPSRQSESLASATRRGLSHAPKFLPCQYIYDATGSELFERICEQPEYYLTRTEDAILRDRAGAMVAGWDEPPTMIELGSGSSSKTRRLIEAALGTYSTLHYVPVDVSATILEASAHALVGDYRGLRVTGIAADYDTAMGLLADRFRGPKLVVFLGSSLGNFDDEDAVGLLRRLSEALEPDDRLLFGTDLVKDADALEAAYDDAAGVTARFSKNILARINRELGGDFDLDRFGYRARYVAGRHRVEMHLISDRRQVVSIPGADLVVPFEEGESIHVENSHKYTTAILDDLAGRSGFAEEACWADAEDRFRVQRWRPVG